jgi:hypothetical protein
MPLIQRILMESLLRCGGADAEQAKAALLDQSP